MLPSFDHITHGAVRLGLARRPHGFRMRALSNYLTPSLSFPPVLAWERPLAWGMLANDSVGDCVIAKTLHQIMCWRSVANASFPAAFTDEEAIGLYSAVTGYIPGDPSTDNGTDPSDMLKYWQTTGVYGHKIDGGASLDISNLQSLKAALYTFGGLEFDLDVPAYVMSVPSGGSWSDTGGDKTILGGHSVLAVGYGADGFRVVSWGATYTADLDFWSQYLIGATAAVSADWIENCGRTPKAGLDLTELLADLQADASS